MSSFDLLLVGGAILLIAAVLYFQLRFYRVMDGAAQRRETDATAERPEPPESIRPYLDSLAVLGFTRIGISGIDLPVGGRQYSWIHRNADGSIHAQVVTANPMAVFISYFAGGTVMLMTSHPDGEMIDDPDLRWHRWTDGGLPGALEHHEEQQRAMQRLHGAPVVLTDMADYLRWDGVGRERFARRQLHGAWLRHQAVPSVLLICGLVAFIVYTLA